jgi:hypothetical protein
MSRGARHARVGARGSTHMDGTGRDGSRESTRRTRTWIELTRLFLLRGCCFSGVPREKRRKKKNTNTFGTPLPCSRYPLLTSIRSPSRPPSTRRHGPRPRASPSSRWAGLTRRLGREPRCSVSVAHGTGVDQLPLYRPAQTMNEKLASHQDK